MTTKEDDPRKPETTFDGEYPHIQSFQTWGGHTLIFDNTPGKETIRLSHGGNTNPGSYIEWSVNGKKVEVVRDNSFNYTKGGQTTSIDGATDTKVASHSRTSVSGGSHKEVAGKESKAVKEGSTVLAGGTQSTGTLSASPGGEHDDFTSGNKTSVHSGNMNTMIEGDNVLVVNGNQVFQNKGERLDTIQDGNYSISVDDGNFKIKCKKFIIEAEEIVFGATQKNITLDSQKAQVIIKSKKGIITKSDIFGTSLEKNPPVLPGGKDGNEPLK